MKIEIIPATETHARLLAPNLRDSDKAEVMASGGREPLDALLGAVDVSEVCWTALIDGFPEIMWGAAPYHIDRFGVVWLLSSDVMYEIKGRFLRESVAYVAKMHETFNTLFNYVDERNVKSQQWLEALGFHAVSTDPQYGHARIPFILYARTNHV